MVNRLNQVLTWLLSSGPGNLLLILAGPFLIGNGSLFYNLRYRPFEWETYFPFIAVYSVTGIFLVTHFGHPRKWWSAFFGITLVVDTDKLHLQDPLKDYRQEISDWVSTMSSGPYKKINSFKYKFLRKRDAAAFKLAWM